MAKSHSFFFALAAVLVALIFTLLPRFEFYPTPNGVTYTYDKWNNNVLICAGNGCKKIEGDLSFKSAAPIPQTAKK